MKWANRRKKRVETAISHYEQKLKNQLTDFRKYAQEYEVDRIIMLLPNSIYDMKDTQLKLQELRNKLSYAMSDSHFGPYSAPVQLEGTLFYAAKHIEDREITYMVR